MHRDDFAQRGLSSGAQTSLPFDVNGADDLLLDDVLYTGRTIRAVLNELFDYGRPASVRLAVLVDRGGRELPMQADFALPAWPAATQSLALARDEQGGFSFHVEEALTDAAQAQPPAQPQRRADPPAVHRRACRATSSRTSSTPPPTS
jgi:pyrimidine operon attenuation protein/uracil phosphoribosyltransferase